MKLLLLCLFISSYRLGKADEKPQPVPEVLPLGSDAIEPEEVVTASPLNLEQLIKGIVSVVSEPRKPVNGGRPRLLKELAENARHTKVDVDKKKPDVAILPMPIAVGEPNPNGAQKPVEFSLDGYFYQGTKKIAAYRIDFRGVHFKKDVKKPQKPEVLVDPRPNKDDVEDDIETKIVQNRDHYNLKDSLPPNKDDAEILIDELVDPLPPKKDDGGILIDEMVDPQKPHKDNGEILIDEIVDPLPTHKDEGEILIDELPPKPSDDKELVDPRPERPELVDPRPEGRTNETPIDESGAEAVPKSTKAVKPTPEEVKGVTTESVGKTTEAVKENGAGKTTEAGPVEVTEVNNTPIDESGAEAVPKTTAKPAPVEVDNTPADNSEPVSLRTTERPGEGGVSPDTAINDEETVLPSRATTAAPVVDDKKSTESPKAEPTSQPKETKKPDETPVDTTPAVPVASESPKSTAASGVKATTKEDEPIPSASPVTGSVAGSSTPITGPGAVTGSFPRYTGVPPKYEIEEGKKCTVAVEFSWNEKAGRCLANGTKVCNDEDWERVLKKTFGECMKTAPRVAPADGNVITDCGLGKVYAQVPGEPSALLYGHRCKDEFCPKEGTCVQEKTAAHCCIIPRWAHYGK